MPSPERGKGKDEGVGRNDGQLELARAFKTGGEGGLTLHDGVSNRLEPSEG